MPGEPVTRIRRTQTGVDAYNNPVYADTTTVLAELAAFDPGGSLEPVEVGRAQVVTTPKAYFADQWPDVVVSDRLVIRGRTFTVQGRPADWRSPWTGMGGLVVELREVEG